jgi:hypothetical protein
MNKNFLLFRSVIFSSSLIDRSHTISTIFPQMTRTGETPPVPCSRYLPDGKESLGAPGSVVLGVIGYFSSIFWREYIASGNKQGFPCKINTSRISALIGLCGAGHFGPKEFAHEQPSDIDVD